MGSGPRCHPPASGRGLSRRLAAPSLLLVIAWLSGGCVVVSYQVDPESAWRTAAPQEKRAETLHYRVRPAKGLTLGGNYAARREMRRNAVFEHSKSVKKSPEQGLYVEVSSKQKPGNTGAWVWGYCAASLAFILPAYHGSTGFFVTYRVIRDRRQVATYEYEVTRKAFAWLPLLLFAWVNLFTDSEEDAYEAITRQFFVDALRDGVFEPPAVRVVPPPAAAPQPKAAVKSAPLETAPEAYVPVLPPPSAVPMPPSGL